MLVVEIMNEKLERKYCGCVNSCIKCRKKYGTKKLKEIRYEARKLIGDSLFNKPKMRKQ